MEPSFSLAYYDRIFGARTPAFYELLQALVEELDSYGREMGPALRAGSAEALSRLRHEHLPMVENLRLGVISALEHEAKKVVENGAGLQAVTDLERRFGQTVKRLSQMLTSELLPGGPKPPEPGRGD